MKERIKEFIDYKGISAGELADLLDVQRSNISHILNGRNKPGAVFIERFLLTFPEVNARWLLTGRGEMINAKEGSTLYKNDTASFTERSENSQKSEEATHPEVPVQDKTVEKVILLYTDGTFSHYTPVN